jgi:hypothetical protein
VMSVRRRDDDDAPVSFDSNSADVVYEAHGHVGVVIGASVNAFDSVRAMHSTNVYVHESAPVQFAFVPLSLDSHDRPLNESVTNVTDDVPATLACRHTRRAE